MSRLERMRARFRTTRWSLVRAAGGESGADSAAALEELCRSYWYPLYAYARRAGHAPEDARDLVQGFFTSLLARNDLAGLVPEGGRFRSYLLGGLRHHIANERERAGALKRGGGVARLGLELESAEGRYACEPADTRSPEALFERKWALTTLKQALGRLEAEQAEKGRARAFRCLRAFLVAGEESIGAAASELKLSANAVRVAVHRLRARYRELLLQEVARTLDAEEDVEDELRRLREAVGS